MVVGVAPEELGALLAAEVELDDVVLGEADAAVDLLAMGDHAAAGLAAPGLRHGRVHVLGRLVLAGGPGGLVGNEAHAVDVGDHVGGLVLDGLEGADGAAELDALLGVVDGDLEVLLGEADEVGVLEIHGDVAAAHARLGIDGHDVLGSDADVVEDDLGLLVAGDGLEEVDLHAGLVAGDDEVGEPAIGGIRDDVQVVGHVGVGHEELRATEHVAVAVGAGGEGVAGAVPAARFLGDCVGVDGGPAGDAGEVLRLLGVVTGDDEPGGAGGVGDEGTGNERPPELLDEDAEVQVAEAGAAVLLGNHEALPAELGHLLPEVRAVAGLVFFHGPHVFFGALVLEEVARRVADQVLLFAEAQIHRCPSLIRVAEQAHRNAPPPRGLAARV